MVSSSLLLGVNGDSDLDHMDGCNIESLRIDIDRDNNAVCGAWERTDFTETARLGRRWRDRITYAFENNRFPTTTELSKMRRRRKQQGDDDSFTLTPVSFCFTFLLLFSSSLFFFFSSYIHLPSSSLPLHHRASLWLMPSRARRHHGSSPSLVLTARLRACLGFVHHASTMTMTVYLAAVHHRLHVRERRWVTEQKSFVHWVCR